MRSSVCIGSFVGAALLCASVRAQEQPSETVRVQTIDQDHLLKLVVELGGQQPENCERAARELRAMGTMAIPILCREAPTGGKLAARGTEFVAAIRVIALGESANEALARSFSKKSVEKGVASELVTCLHGDAKEARGALQALIVLSLDTGGDVIPSLTEAASTEASPDRRKVLEANLKEIVAAHLRHMWHSTDRALTADPQLRSIPTEIQERDGGAVRRAGQVAIPIVKEYLADKHRARIIWRQAMRNAAGNPFVSDRLRRELDQTDRSITANMAFSEQLLVELSAPVNPKNAVGNSLMLPSDKPAQPESKDGASTGVVSDEKKQSYELLKRLHAEEFRNFSSKDEQLKAKITAACKVRDDVVIEAFQEADLHPLKFLDKFDVREEKPETTGYDNFRGITASSKFEAVRYTRGMLSALPQVQGVGSRAGMLRGIEQAYELALDVQSLSWQLTASIGQRMWARLNPSERELCGKHQSDFAYFASGEAARKLEELDQQVTADANNVDARLERAKLQFRQFQHRLALADLAKVIELDRGHQGEALYLRGCHYADFSQIDAAKRDFTKLLSVKGRDAEGVDMSRVKAFLTLHQ